MPSDERWKEVAEEIEEELDGLTKDYVVQLHTYIKELEEKCKLREGETIREFYLRVASNAVS